MDKGKAPPLEEVNGPSPSLCTVPVEKEKAPFLEEGEVNGPLVPLQAGEPGNTTQRASSDVNLFSHDVNIMPLSPQRNFGHRRAHLEAFCHNNDEELINIYFDMEKFSSETPISEKSCEKLLLVSEERMRVGHQCSQSLDVSDLIKPHLLMSSLESLSTADRRKAKSAAKLAEIALVDPKRARRYGFLNRHFKINYFVLTLE